MLERFPSLTQGGKICDSCRKQLAQITVKSNLDESCDDDVDSSYTYQYDQLESINECLKAKPQLSERSLCTQVTKKKSYVK